MFDYECPHCESEMKGSFGDQVECLKCNIVFETEWDYIREGELASWLTGVEYKKNIMIKKYFKKPIVIEAIEYQDTPECLALLSEFTGQDLVVHYGTNEKYLGIATLEDKDGMISHWASVGDFIIKGINGEFYPCKMDIFYKTYELIND